MLLIYADTLIYIAKGLVVVVVSFVPVVKLHLKLARFALVEVLAKAGCSAKAMCTT